MRAWSRLPTSPPSHDGLPPLSEGRRLVLIHARGLFGTVTADPRRGEPLASAAVEAARRARDPEVLAHSLRALAWAYRARWDEASALRLLNEAVRVARSGDLAEAEASALVSRAVVRQELGRPTAARRDLEGALAAISRAIGVSPGDTAHFRAQVGLQRAVIEQNAGRLGLAEDRYWSLLRASGLTDDVAVKITNNLALVLAHRGAYASALVQSDEAVRLAGLLGPGVLAPAVQTRAWIAVQSGRLAEGLRDFDRAAQTYAGAELSMGEYYAEYADAMMDMRLLPEAATAAAKAADEFEAAGAPLMRTEAQLRLARIALLTGDIVTAQVLADALAAVLHQQRRSGWRDRAVLIGVEAQLLAGTAGAAELDLVRRAARRFESAGDRLSAVEAHLLAGRVALGGSGSAVASSALTRASGLARKGPVLLRIRGRLAGALSARSDGRESMALAECRAGLRDLADHRSALPTMELRALASGHGAELGEIGLRIVLSQGSPARTFAWMEKTRAAALVARAPGVVEGPADGRPPRPARQSQLAGAGCRADAGDPPGPDPQRHVRTEGWGSAADGRRGRARASEPPLGLGALRDLLAGRSLVEYGCLDGRLVAVVVDPRRARLVELGSASDVAEQLRALFFALRRLADPRGPAAAGAARVSADLRVARLRRMLVEPLGVASDDELVVVPVGLLHGVPWSALHDGPLALAPSAMIWARTRRTTIDRAATTPGARGLGRAVLVAGPELAGALDEVESLRAVYPGALVLGPEQSQAGEVLRALTDADLAHLACHGRLRADNPLFSALVLADGPLTVQELHGAGVVPHRLVLASCHSGADVAYAGDEVIGFVSAMLAQGTAGVVASIAAIPDVAAVDLMMALHRGLAAGDTLALALHAARAAIDREVPEGYVNWCTFSAHGAA